MPGRNTAGGLRSASISHLVSYYDDSTGAVTARPDGHTGTELIPGFYPGSNEQHRLF